jgi:multidrug transporter EmrE-like cation transporter
MTDLFVKLIPLLTIVSSVLLSAVSQILMKRGMVSNVVRRAIAEGDPLTIVITVATTPSILLGFLCFAVSVLMWLMVLARTPLSTAYPFVALGITLTVAAGVALFGEPLSIQKIVGVVLIIIGIVAVASA